MKLKLLALAIGAALSAGALADSHRHGPMAFTPIVGSAYAESTTDAAILNAEPWVIPAGYQQVIVSDESDLNLYQNGDQSAASDWPDMNTVKWT